MINRNQNSERWKENRCSSHFWNLFRLFFHTFRVWVRRILQSNTEKTSKSEQRNWGAKISPLTAWHLLSVHLCFSLMLGSPLLKRPIWCLTVSSRTPPVCLGKHPLIKSPSFHFLFPLPLYYLFTHLWPLRPGRCGHEDMRTWNREHRTSPPCFLHDDSAFLSTKKCIIWLLCSYLKSDLWGPACCPSDLSLCSIIIHRG